MLDAEGLDEPLDPPCRHPAHVALADHLGERSLGSPAGLEQPAGEVAARAQLRDREVDRARPGVEVPVAQAVARVHPLRGDLAVARVADGVDLGGHQALCEHPDHLSQQVAVAALFEVLAQQRHRVHGCSDFHRISFSFVLPDKRD